MANAKGLQEVRMSNIGHHAKTLPSDLSAPAFVDTWRTRALIIGVVFLVVAVILGFLSGEAGTTSCARGCTAI